MKKNNTKKRMTLTILEGVWGSGKTTLARTLKTNYHAYIVKEPHHVRAGVTRKDAHFIMQWYLSSHKKNLEKGAALARRGQIVVIERSVLSSIAFAKVFLKKELKTARSDFERTIQRLRAEGVEVHIVYLSRTDTENVIARMKRSVYLKKFADMYSVKELDACLLRELRALKKKKVLCFKTVMLQ
jgi:thymidylate kinase